MNIAVDEQTRTEQLRVQAARRRKRTLACASAGAAACVALLAGGWWVQIGQYRETTDDAYVRADWVAVSARVAGYVEQVEVDDDATVQAGQILVRIQDRDYRQRQVLAQAECDGAVAQLSAAQAEQRRSALDLRRYQGLVSDAAATAQRLERARARAETAQASVASAQAALAAARARLALAEQNRQDTEIKAPLDGVVGQRRVRAGQYVTPGQPLLAVVPVHQAYVVANFKETQLAHMRPGQPVTLAVDSFPDRPLHGHVASLSPGSGSVFALLPSDNATGNFTKIVQRVPVRILLEAPEPRLLPGLSVIATVDTHER